MVGSEYAESICNELVWPDSSISSRTRGWPKLLYQGSAGVGLLNNWDINVLPLNVSNDLDTLNQIRIGYPELQAIPAVRRHPALFELRSQHLPRGDTASREAVFERRNVELILDMVKNNQRRGRGRRRQRHHLVQPAAGERPRGVRHQPPLCYDRHIRAAGRQRQAIHELGRLEERDLRRLGTWWPQHFMTGQPVTITFSGSPNVYLPGAYASKPAETQ